MSAKKRTRSSTTQKKKNTRKSVRRKPYGEKQAIGFIFCVCFGATLFLACFLSAMVALKIPDIRTVKQYKPLQTTTIVDINGAVIHRIYKENRQVISLKQMPELMPKAFVSAEDGRFFDHPGLDFFSVIRAALINIRRGKKAQGGSTITQQVARSLLLNREKTYLRKFKEAILAWRIDTMLSKKEILYIYLNQIYLGSGAHGVEAASQLYFGKPAATLGLAEIAVLAGLPQAPSRYSPLKNMSSSRARQRYVLNRMAADGYITKKQAKEAFDRGLHLQKSRQENCADCGYYVNRVRHRARKITGRPLTRQGLKIHTYLDLSQQQAAVRAVKSGVMTSFSRQVRKGRQKRKVPQGALVSIDACTGRIGAMIGGVDFKSSSYDRAATARRPAGSAFKPVVYSAALMKGYDGETPILDAPLSIRGGVQGVWQPKNYSGKYHGQTTLSTALAHSYNTAAVRLLQKVGLNKVEEISRQLGITSDIPKDLSLALGSLDVSLLELTAAYSAFICEGRYIVPQFIKKIEDSSGKVVFQPVVKTRRVLTKQMAADMKSMLRRGVTEGTGHRARGLTGHSGGKTGTTDNNRDAWFIGFNKTTITGVWVGHDNNKSLGPDENGGRTATPIWRDFMQNTTEDR